MDVEEEGIAQQSVNNVKMLPHIETRCLFYFDVFLNELALFKLAEL
jgi:hypothetical protein